MELLNATELALKLHKSKWWLVQARKAGMPFACGLITVEDAWNWMKQNPDFQAKDWLKEPLRKRISHQPLTVDKPCESSDLHDQQTSSPSTLKHPHEQAA